MGKMVGQDIGGAREEMLMAAATKELTVSEAKEF